MTPDEDKTKAELVKEIDTLCRHISELSPKQVRLKASKSRRRLTVESATANRTLEYLLLKGDIDYEK